MVHRRGLVIDNKVVLPLYPQENLLFDRAAQCVHDEVAWTTGLNRQKVAAVDGLFRIGDTKSGCAVLYSSASLV